MLANLAAAAWRSALRDRLHVSLNVAGLALGFAAAILIFLFVRHELAYDRFFPDYRNVYRVQLTVFDPARPPETIPSTTTSMAAELRGAFPEIVAATRFAGQQMGLRAGAVEGNEAAVSVDPNFFSVLGFPLLRGDRATALAAPDSIVLSKATAIKYFGTVDCVGRRLEIDRRHPVRVTGVMADVTRTEIRFPAILSGNSAFSSLARLDAEPKSEPGDLEIKVESYVRLAPGTDPATLRGRLDRFVAEHYPPGPDEPNPSFRIWLKPIALQHLHDADPDAPDPSARATTLDAVAATGILILVVAAINFVNLLTARATRRGVEVGVRKALGATRAQLMLQFVGESVAYSLAAMVLAVAATELALPRFEALLDRRLGFDYWRDPALAGTLLGAALLVGIAAGIYPALVQIRFRPAVTLKGGKGSTGSGRVRQALVVLQFAVSVGLLVATAIIYRQTEFATRRGLGFDTGQVLTIDLSALEGMGESRRLATIDALKTRLARVPGVRAVTGSWIVPNTTHASHETIRDARTGQRLTIDRDPVDFGFFGVYGVRLLAGRDFAADRGDAALPVEAQSGGGTAILNETAVRALGYGSPAAAIGRQVIFDAMGGGDGQVRRIVGVVPDMQMNTARDRIPPTLFVAAPDHDETLSLKLDGRDLAGTLDRIDRAWAALVSTRPIRHRFLDERIEELYRELRLDGTIFAAFALVAVAISCLGLFGLSAFAAERRTKEIGIRKALGAATGDVVRLMVWQFSRPVLLADLVACPLVWLAMRRWLDGFAYRIPLDAGPFLAAAAAALAIAALTTIFHAVQAARARPVASLRYE